MDGTAELRSSGRRVMVEAPVIMGLSKSDSVSDFSATSPRTPIRGSLDGPGIVKSPINEVTSYWVPAETEESNRTRVGLSGASSSGPAIEIALWGTVDCLRARREGNGGSLALPDGAGIGTTEVRSTGGGSGKILRENSLRPETDFPDDMLIDFVFESGSGGGGKEVVVGEREKRRRAAMLLSSSVC